MNCSDLHWTKTFHANMTVRNSDLPQWKEQITSFTEFALQIQALSLSLCMLLVLTRKHHNILTLWNKVMHFIIHPIWSVGFLRAFYYLSCSFTALTRVL